MEATTATHRAKRARSPSYPGIGLEQAIERARTLYAHERRNAAPIDAILHHWGYKPKSGAGLVALAALKKFGLATDEGSGDARRARLTDLAFDIILDPREDSPERRAAIQRAALAPSIHRELVQRYPDGLPSDATMEHYLIRERAFTEAAARELIGELRRTLDFAGLADGAGTVSGQEPDTSSTEQEPDMSGAVTQPAETAGTSRHSPRSGGSGVRPQQRSIQLPVPGTSWVTVQGDFPLTEDAWDQMIKLLDAMKPGLVEQPRPEPAPEQD